MLGHLNKVNPGAEIDIILSGEIQIHCTVTFNPHLSFSFPQRNTALATVLFFCHRSAMCIYLLP